MGKSIKRPCLQEARQILGPLHLALMMMIHDDADNEHEYAHVHMPHSQPKLLTCFINC